MGKNRKLVFKEEIKKREENRVKRFKIITIFITFIVCVFIILFDLWNYNQIKIKTPEYINITKDIWYEGIKEIKCKELNIRILDSNIKYEEIYNKGINYIGYNKIKLKMHINNRIWIIQNENSITINDDLTGKVATLEFNENDIEVVDEAKKSFIRLTSSMIITCIGMAAIIIALYTNINSKEERMIKDLNKLYPNNCIL